MMKAFPVPSMTAMIRNMGDQCFELGKPIWAVYLLYILLLT